MTAHASFSKYLMSTMLGGGALGAAHGIVSSMKNHGQYSSIIFHDAMAGAIMAPWTPVLLPLTLANVWPHGKCPYKFRNSK
jgi:hypothetical protein